jgi:GAF domain-containing protein
VDQERLAQAFVELAETLVDDFDVHDVLRVLAATGAALLGTAAAGLLLADEHGRLQVAAASAESAGLLDLFQLQVHEGPCLECFRSGQTVIADAAAVHARWPRFGEAVAARGYGGVLAMPMRLRGEVIGTLNLFAGDADSRPLAESSVAVAQAMADVATIAILQHRLSRNRELVNAQLQGALRSRVVIEQAKGALAERSGIDPDEAFTRLRARARSSRRTLVDVAREVLAQTGDGASPP